MTKFDHGGKIFATARRLGLQPEEILDFSASINPLGMAAGVKEAVCSLFDRLRHYPDNEAAELRIALACHHGLEPDQICLANGSTELIYLIPRLVKGRKALLVAPPFSEYANSLKLAGWECSYHCLKAEDGFVLSHDVLAERLKEGCELLFLCNPGNPTGKLLLQQEIAQLLDMCQESNTFLVLDEAFMDFCESASAKHLVAEGRGSVVLRSMTKFHAIPGLRLGYSIASPEVTALIAAQRQPWAVNTAAQLAGCAALLDKGHMERTLRYVDAERTFLMTGLASIHGLCPYPSAANYILVAMANGGNSRNLQEELLDERILIRDCSSFQGLDDRFFRVAVRTRNENESLLRALAGAETIRNHRIN